MTRKHESLTHDELDKLTNQHSDTELAKILNLARANVHLLRRHLNVKSYSEKTGKGKSRKTGEAVAPGGQPQISFNRRFFQVIDTEEKAYFLGFLMADGAVRKDKRCVYVGLKASDIEHLKKLCLALALTEDQIVSRVWRLNGKEYPGVELYLCSSEMCEDLIGHGINAGGTKTTSCKLLTQLPADLIKPFVRGLFDGNGCVTLSRTDRGTINSSKSSLVTASSDLLEQLVSWLSVREIPFKATTRRHRERLPLHILTLGSVRQSLFLKWIYTDATIYLTRKYDLWKSVSI